MADACEHIVTVDDRKISVQFGSDRRLLLVQEVPGTLETLTFLPLKGPPGFHWSGEQHAFLQKVRNAMLGQGVIASDGCCDCH